jgi:hypothetical protein
VWIWLIVLLPLLSIFPAFIYLDQMLRGMVGLVATLTSDGPPLDAERLLAAELGLLFSPWFLVAMVVGWGTSALCVWFGALDSRELERRGFADPFPWPWMLLSSLVYLIGRRVAVRRQGGRGSEPLFVMIAVQVAIFLATMIWVLVLIVQLTAATLTSTGSGTALENPGESVSPAGDEWVVVTFEDREDVFDLSLMEAMLATELAADEALAAADAGHIDGNEIGAGEYALFFVGPDADRIWGLIRPVFDDAPIQWTRVELMEGLDDSSPVTITP